MNYDEALAYATAAHDGQEFQSATGPEPYIVHLVRVGLCVPKRSKLVAILHDVLDETGRPLPPDLKLHEREALILLSRGSLPHKVYIQRIRMAGGIAGVIAREVKLAAAREKLLHIHHGEEGRARELETVASMLLGA